MRKLLAILLTVAGATVALPAVASAAPSGGIQLGSIGEDPAALDGQLDTAVQLHAKVVRTDFVWANAEPTQGNFSSSYFGLLDRFEQDAKARGLQTLVTVVGTPCWASSSPSKAGCSATNTPDSVASWAPTDGALAAGVFGQVAQHLGAENVGIEVWNEPDQSNQLYFKTADPNVKSPAYVSLLKAAYTAVKGANPNVKVLGGAFVGYNGAFLQGMYNQGAKGFYDALDVHYYDLALTKLRAIRKVMAKNGDNAPVWLGEFGFDSCYPERQQGPHTCLTQTNQAKALNDVFYATRNTSWLLGGVVYTLDDTPGHGQFKFGLRGVSGKPKPSFATVQRAFQGRATKRAISLRLRRQGKRTRVSVSGPFADSYAISVRVHGRLRFKGQFRLGAKGTFSLLLPSQVGARGVKVRVTYLWTGAGASKTLR